MAEKIGIDSPAEPVSDLSESSSSGAFVSVIIPVYNDSQRLKICLEALAKQTYPKKLYEVIVVDNASTEDIKSVVSQFEQARYAYESRPGSYIARNKGLLSAKGDVLAFTDSDCIPIPGWIEKGVAHLVSTPNCGLVAGKISLFFQNPQEPTAVELYEKIVLNFFQDKKLKDHQFGMTANIFTFKAVMDDVGGFDSTLKSGGDRQWGQRVFAAGYQQVYADDACVDHPARHSYAELRKRITRLVGGRHDRLLSKNPSSVEIAKDIVDMFKPPFRSLYRAFKNEELEGLDQKLKFISVIFFARYIDISEKIRLYLGGRSQRG